MGSCWRHRNDVADDLGRTWLVVAVLLLTSCIVKCTSTIASERTLHEVCQWEKFQAECPSDSVIVIDSAMHGRRAGTPGRCIQRVYDQFNCLVDVLTYADRLCSGRRRCEIQIPDANLERSPHGCPGDLKTNLEISYHCVTVQRIASRSASDVSSTCDHASLTVTEPTGFLASVVSDEMSARTSRSCPWTLQAQPGQTVKLTLFDFGVWSSADPSGSYARHRGSDSQSCAVTYAIIRERSSSMARTQFCRGQSRDSVVVRSQDHVVNVTVSQTRPEVDGMALYFLIKYEFEGCADLPTQPDTVFDRSGDSAVIRCTSGSGSMTSDSSELRQQSVRCVAGSWSPTPTLNCSLLAGTSSAANSAGFDLGVFALSKQGLLIIVVVGIALFVSLCIVIIGIICLCRSQSQNRFTHSDNNLQYVSAPSAKFDPSRTAGTADVTWNELHPMLLANKMSVGSGGCGDYSMDGSRLACGSSQHSTERDYATTLQMRRIGGPPLQPIVLRPAGYDPVTPGCCTCPVHGPQSMLLPYDESASQMPPYTPNSVDEAPTSPITPTRFSSFRPRIEHIYEVPKFADGDDDCREADECTSPLYNELDSRAFGTVGRRLPASGSSSRSSGRGPRPEL